MSLDLKKKVLSILVEEIETKMTQLDTAISEIKASRNDNTKSSAGDKYETARAMMQIELEKNETQRQKSRELLKYLSQIDLSKTYNKVDFGSFICSKEHFYFLAIGYGKMIIDDSQVFVLSLASPIGQQLKHKKVGDSIQFQNQTIEILEII